MTPVKLLAVLVFIGGNIGVLGARVAARRSKKNYTSIGVEGNLKCVITGPAESGLLYSWGPVPRSNCFTECKAMLYRDKKGFSQVFKNAFEPMPLPKGRCGCFVDGENKLTLKLDNVKGHPHCTDRAQENCWYVYEIFMKMHEKTNLWDASHGCQPCDTEGSCNEVRIPIRIDQEQVAGLKQAAADGDNDAIEALELLERDSMVELDEEELDAIERRLIQSRIEQLALAESADADDLPDITVSDYDEELATANATSTTTSEPAEVDDVPDITVSDYDEELARANAFWATSTTTSEPAEVDDLPSNLHSNDSEGEDWSLLKQLTQQRQVGRIMENGAIGVRCKVISAKRRRFLWRTWTQQVSTCGSVEVPGAKYSSMYGEAVVGPSSNVALRCYKPGEAGSSIVEAGGEGICRIPRRKFCDPSLTPRQPKSGGCRYGTVCRHKTYYTGDGWSAHGWYSTYTCREPDETYY